MTPLALVLMLQVAADDPGIRLRVEDGFRLVSADGAFEFHIGGRLIEEYRATFASPISPRIPSDTFYVREAFFDFDGTVHRDFLFLVRAGFDSTNPGGGARLDEGWLEWRRWSSFGLRFGQYRQPAGQEGLTSTLFTDCIARSVLNRFVPNQEVGLMASGEVEGGLLAYQLSVANGRSEPSAPVSSPDNNDGKEAILRLTSSPFAGDGESFFRRLRFGVYGSIAKVDAVPMATEFDLVSPGLSVLFMDSTAGLLDGRAQRAGAELSWVLGPASLRGEVLWRRDSVQDAADTIHERMVTRAWYGQVTCILFGAEKVSEGRLIPARPFDLDEGHWGALEAVVRVSGARVGGSELVAVGNSLAGQSNSLLEYTVGLNWVPVRNVRLAADLVLEDYRDRVAFTPSTSRSSLAGVLLRFQVDF